MKTPSPRQPVAEQPQIEYPCPWVYTVIGENQDQLTTIIKAACAPAVVEIRLSHRSASGRYLSLHASLTVDSEASRQAIYQSLQSNPAIKTVL